MPTGAEADQIHLRVPTRPPMAPVVGVAVRVLAGRTGLSDAAIEAARNSVDDAYAELVDSGDPGPVDIYVQVRPGRLHVDLRGATGTRTVTVPT